MSKVVGGEWGVDGKRWTVGGWVVGGGQWAVVSVTGLVGAKHVHASHLLNGAQLGHNRIFLC